MKFPYRVIIIDDYDDYDYDESPTEFEVEATDIEHAKQLAEDWCQDTMGGNQGLNGKEVVVDISPVSPVTTHTFKIKT